MVVNNTYEIGDTVYLKTDPNQFPRIITRFCVNPGGVITYECFSGNISSWHYDIEFSTEKNTVLTTTN
jgi:hypothetical protein